MSDIVGSARVRIEPDLGDFDAKTAADVEKALRKLDEKLGSAAGARLGRGISRQIGTELGSSISSLGARIGASATSLGERIGGLISRGLKIGLVAGAAAVAAAVGGVLFKGFQRFTTIEDATASLTVTLGSATKAGQLLGEVLKIVEGTPFSLAQFAEAAKNLVNFGVDAAKVPTILRAIGEAASASGRGAEAVSAIVDALGDASARGRITLDTISRLAEQGVPALQILANQFGVTTNEMAKMITKGAVPAQRGIDLLAQGILKGTTAIVGNSIAINANIEQTRALARVRREAAESAVDHARAIRDADRAIIESAESHARAIRDADRDVVDAEDSVQDALENSKRAQESLNDARKSAIERLEDLSLAVRGDAISEERAALRVKEAERALEQARKGKDALRLRDAELDLEEARIAQEEAAHRATRDQEELTERRKDGVKGSKEVVAAEERIAAAKDAVVDAQQKVIDSEEQARRARKEAADASVEAAERAQLARREAADASVDSAERVRKAEEDLAEAVTKSNAEIQAALDGSGKSTIAFEGTMATLGDNVSGALENLSTAFARLGAKILTSFDAPEGGGQLTRTLKDVRDAVDELAVIAGQAADAIVGSDGFGKVLRFFDLLPERINRFGDAVDAKGFKQAFTDLFGTITLDTLAAKFLDKLLDAFDKLPHEKISKAITAFIVRGIEGIATGIEDITAAVVRAAPAIIKGIAKGLLKSAKKNPLNVGGLLVAMGLPVIGPAITGLLAGVLSKIPIASILAPLVRTLGSGMQTLIGGLITRLVPLISGIIPAIGSALAAAAPAIAVLLGVALGVVLHKLIDIFVPGINRFLEGVGAVLFTFFAETLPRFFSTTLPRVFGNVVSFFAQLPGRIVGALGNLGSAMFNFGLRALQSIGSGLAAGLSAVLRFFTDLPGRIIGALGDLVRTFFEIGQNIIGGIVDGIKKAVADLANRLPGFLKDRIPKPIRDFFGIHSPSKLMFAIGEDIGEGLNLGVLSAMNDLDVLRNIAALTSQANLGRVLATGNTTIVQQGGTPAASGTVFSEGAIQITTASVDERVLANELAFKLGRESHR